MDKVIFLATGGTGGHIFPARALGEELKKRGYEPIIISDERFLKYTDSNESFKYFILPVEQPKGGLKGKIKSGISIVKSYFLARKYIAEYKPLCVVGFGGYPSFPTVMAASQLGAKTIIHEQNCLLGSANRVLLKNADYLALGAPEIVGVDDRFQNKIVFTGNPVRKAIREIANEPRDNYNKINILITGGSQGASLFSRIVPAAIEMLPVELHGRISITQQARKETIADVETKYIDLKIERHVREFFTDMDIRIKNADIMIVRSGASTLAEASFAGRACIMIPLKNSKGDHQLINARSFEKVGGGIVIEEKDLTAESLSKTLEELLNNAEKIRTMSENAKKFSSMDAEIKLANLVEKAINQ